MKSYLTNIRDLVQINIGNHREINKQTHILNYISTEQLPETLFQEHTFLLKRNML